MRFRLGLRLGLGLGIGGFGVDDSELGVWGSGFRVSGVVRI